MVSPSDMLLFASIVREGSFTRAARRLGITKQSASERLGKLEAQLGVRLLERTTRQLRVTGPGATYYERCAAIAAQIDEANAEVQQQLAQAMGLLRVSSPSLFGRRYLGPVVSEFLARHPKLQVELVLADRPVHVLEEGLDVAIHAGPLDDSSLVARRLGEGAVYYVASPRYLARHGTPEPRALGAARCIALSAFETWSVGGVKARIEPVLTVNDLEVACDAALAGVGIARVPGILCHEAVRDGRLKVLFGPRPALVRTFHAVYPSRASLPPKVRLFVELLAERLPPMLALPGSPRRRRARAAR
ncbi:LysR family transcriptional regulator [Aggregicoccus sp. 17bor-14]|nr:LysR family transcriptional regulator [Simulacricoccus sp. 17bor-14]MRI87723.1 LysR family transcriptional regulator [Aggregicoccus sp. 17bor-14]